MPVSLLTALLVVCGRYYILLLEPAEDRSISQASNLFVLIGVSKPHMFRNNSYIIMPTRINKMLTRIRLRMFQMEYGASGNAAAPPPAASASSGPASPARWRRT